MPRPSILNSIGLAAAGLIICGMPLWFAAPGFKTYFTDDDAMNLYGYWSKPWRDLLIANVAYFSPFYRPLGGLFYRSMFACWGFEPFPIRAACFIIMLANLGLLYGLARELSGSREIACLAALLNCYHAGYVNFYYNTAIYDLLCFSCYIGALLLYVSGRKNNQPLRLTTALWVAGLYICSLNAKEMGVTLPAALLLYELVYHWPKRDFLRWIIREVKWIWILAILTVPYIAGKLSNRSPFAHADDYQVHLSLSNYFSNYQGYLDQIFYAKAGSFTLSRTLLLWTAMLLVAFLTRRKALIFASIFVLFSVLPVIFVTQRGTIFVMYVPMIGWTIYAATLLVLVRDRLLGSFRAPAVTAATFAAVTVSLFLIHRAHTHPVSSSDVIPSMVRQMHALLPSIPPNTRILFLDDPFTTDEWTPVYLVRLSYRDDTLQVDRLKMMRRVPSSDEMKSYNIVLTYRDHEIVRVNPS
jgi:hypothetical protein